MDLQTKNRLITVLIIALVGSASFGLGRLSVLMSQKVPIKIEQNLPSSNQQVLGSSSQKLPENQSQKLPTPSSGEDKPSAVVASKNGTKYHYPWCSGAKTISPENKITFNSAALAEKAGYTLASNCKALAPQ
jgi:hypothetical protein